MLADLVIIKVIDQYRVLSFNSEREPPAGDKVQSGHP
jgi:hypothetical protein